MNLNMKNDLIENDFGRHHTSMHLGMYDRANTVNNSWDYLISPFLIEKIMCINLVKLSYLIVFFFIVLLLICVRSSPSS